jgi:tRNA-specific 2-thiouridylase
MCLGSSGDPDSATRGCCSPQDAADARLVAHKLGIPLFVLNLADSFDEIINYFVEEYRVGRTPNPCIHCNARIKFGKLMKYADSLGIREIATGHYARIIGGSDRARIARKMPRQKDQSYALFALDRSVLSRIVFPLGETESARPGLRDGAQSSRQTR